MSERTLRRDMDRLRTLGYPVEATTGPAGGYQLRPIADIPPLLLDEEEAVAIAIGLRTAAGGTVAGIEETSLRALAKLEQVLPPRIRSQVNTLQSMVAPLIQPWVTVDADVLATLARASRDGERIRFEYTARDGTVTDRNVEPHRLVALYHRWYLLAWDRDREDWRTFRIDRVRDPWPTKMRFEPRPIPGGDPVQHVMDSMGAMPLRHRVTVLLEASLEEMEGKIRPREGELERVGEGRCRFRTQTDSLEWMTMRLLWLGVDFRVETPHQMVQHVESLAATLARAAADTRA